MKLRLRYQLTLGLMFVVAGLLMLFTLQKQVPKPTVIGTAPINQSVQPQPETQLTQGKPVRIEIPSLNINLSIIDGHYNDETKAWTLSNDKAQYAVMTPQANNQSGNTFVYGHAVQPVFGKLPKIKAGEKVILTTDNGKRFTYTFRSAYETNPYDDKLFRYEGPPILTLQTCSGLWYQNRMLFTFDLTEVA